MKISIDDQEIFTLTETQKRVIQNDIPSEIFEEDMKRRLKWVLFDEKYARCMQRLRKEWEPVFKAEGAISLPTSDDEFAELVFTHQDYKDRSTRNAEELVKQQQVVKE
jgi:hypothetical protein